MPKYVQYSLVGIGLFFIIVYYGVVITTSLNIPFTDDLSVLCSLYDIHRSSSSSIVIKLLFSFHNEHRLVLPRLITLGLAKLNNGVIDFRWWIWAGNGLLILILYVLYQVFATYQKSFVFFVPVVLLLFQPLHTELMYWGMASLQNIGVLALATSVLYLITRAHMSVFRLGLIGLLTLSAMLTGGNGLLLILPVGVLWLIMRRYQLAISWLIVGGITAGLYWWGFDAVPQVGGVKTSPTLGDSVLTFLGLMGAFIESQRFEFISVGVGLVFLVAWSRLIIWKLPNLLVRQPLMHDRRTLFLLGLSLFLVLTISAIAVSRHLDAALHVSRYKIYPVLLIICFYLLCLDRLPRIRWSIMVIILVCGIANLIAYKRAWPVLTAHRTYLTRQLGNWQQYRRVDAPTQLEQHYYEQCWTNAYQEGLYYPPTINPVTAQSRPTP